MKENILSFSVREDFNLAILQEKTATPSSEKKTSIALIFKRTCPLISYTRVERTIIELFYNRTLLSFSTRADHHWMYMKTWIELFYDRIPLLSSSMREYIH